VLGEAVRKIGDVTLITMDAITLSFRSPSAALQGVVVKRPIIQAEVGSQPDIRLGLGVAVTPPTLSEPGGRDKHPGRMSALGDLSPVAVLDLCLCEPSTFKDLE
jgi:hypothetical protein